MKTIIAKSLALISGLIAGLTVGSGGQLAVAQTGEGPLTLHPVVVEGYEKFKRNPGRYFFAISEDGRTYGYSYCPSDYCKNTRRRTEAIYQCEKVAKTRCFIYANRNRVEWTGNITVRKVLASETKTEAVRKKQDVAVCNSAITLKDEKYVWDDSTAFQVHATEARRRGFTPSSCAKLVGRKAVLFEKNTSQSAYRDGRLQGVDLQTDASVVSEVRQKLWTDFLKIASKNKFTYHAEPRSKAVSICASWKWSLGKPKPRIRWAFWRFGMNGPSLARSQTLQRCDKWVDQSKLQCTCQVLRINDQLVIDVPAEPFTGEGMGEGEGG